MSSVGWSQTQTLLFWVTFWDRREHILFFSRVLTSERVVNREGEAIVGKNSHSHRLDGGDRTKVYKAMRVDTGTAKHMWIQHYLSSRGRRKEQTFHAAMRCSMVRHMASELMLKACNKDKGDRHILGCCGFWNRERRHRSSATAFDNSVRRRVTKRRCRCERRI